MMWTYPDGSERRLYDEIKSGRKTSEWRDVKKFWMRRLLKITEDKIPINKVSGDPGFMEGPFIDLTGGLKVGRAWFVEGFPKNSFPRLEATITGLIWHETGQFEIQFNNVVEIIH